MDFGKPTDPQLPEMLRRAREAVDAMTPEAREAMCKAQALSWARAEAQWNEDATVVVSP